MHHLLGALIAVGLCFGTGCGHDDHGDLGPTCSDDHDCWSGSSCEDKKAGGFCAELCNADDQCAHDFACVDAHRGTCHLLCQHDDDCPYGFKCKDKKNKGRGGESPVCEP